MNDQHDVISAFLDDEPFDARELGEALSHPSGRALLIDLVALRHVVQPADGIATVRQERRSAWRPLLAAAAVLVALAGGYVIGERRSALVASDPPSPSRVVQADAWQPLPGGGGR
jgi:hypothetical protein